MKLKPLTIAIAQTTGSYADSLRRDEKSMSRLALHFNQFYRREYNAAKRDIQQGK